MCDSQVKAACFVAALLFCGGVWGGTVREEVLPFRGPDRDVYSANGVYTVKTEADGHPHFGWRKGAKEVNLWYSARWGVKPIAGGDSYVVETEAGTGTAGVEFVRQRDRKKVFFEGAWTNGVAVIAANLPHDALYEFSRLVFRPTAGTSDVQTVLKRLTAVREASSAEALRLEVETGNAWHAVTGTNRPSFLLTNLADRELAFRGKLKLRDFFGEGFDLPFEKLICGGETVTVPLDRPLPAKGLWRVRAEVNGGEGNHASPAATFAYLDEHPITPVQPYGTFRMGTVCHIEFFTPYDREVCYDALVAMGAKMVRCNLCMMGLMQPNGPEQFLTAKQDEILGKFAEHGIAVDTLLTWAPRWSFNKAHRKICDGGVGIGPITPEPEPFGAFCEKLARRYGTKIAYYETSNEVDLRPAKYGTVDELIAFQKAGYEGVKRGCPEAKVLTPGFGPFDSGSGQVTQKGCQEDFCDRARAWYDVHAVHAHGGYLWFVDGLYNRFLKWRRERGLADKPWFPNETALTTCLGQENDAAECVWKKILVCRANGAVDYVWYNLRAKGWNPDDGEIGYGMLTADYHPRATYPAFSAFTALAGGCQGTKRVDSTANRFVFTLKPDAQEDNIVVAGWDEDVTDVPWTLKVVTDAKKAHHVDLMGNRRPLAVKDGVVAFSMAKCPAALLLEGATKAEPDATSLMTPPPPPKPIARISVLPIEKRPQPDIVLDRHAQVKEIYEANPVYQHRYWKGPDDLSVKAWLGRGAFGKFNQPNNLRIRVEVRDDVHSAPKYAEKMYLNDSVQVAFGFPGQKGGWEFGFGCGKDGAPQPWAWIVPEGFDARAVTREIELAVKREGAVTVYDAVFPFAALGISWEGALVKGFRFNLLVNEDDGEGRDGWIEVKQGIAGDKAYSQYPLVIFDGKWKIGK